MNNFKMMKVFNIQDAPADIVAEFLEVTDWAGNDCYILWAIHDTLNTCVYEENLPPNANIIDIEEDDGRKLYTLRGLDIVSDWLYDNGATIGEEVIVKHWW